MTWSGLEGVYMRFHFGRNKIFSIQYLVYLILTELKHTTGNICACEYKGIVLSINRIISVALELQSKVLYATEIEYICLYFQLKQITKSWACHLIWNSHRWTWFSMPLNFFDNNLKSTTLVIKFISMKIYCLSSV